MTGQRQATVATYDTTLGTGSALGDDGTEWRFDLAAVASSVRLLRLGQRVRLDLDGDHVVAVTLM